METLTENGSNVKAIHLPNLYAHGCDPTTNVGMSNLCRLRRRANEDMDGDESIVFVCVGGWCYSFGADARIVARNAKFLGVETTGDFGPGLGVWSAVRHADLRAVVNHLWKAGCLPCSVVNHVGRRIDLDAAEGGVK